MKKLSLKELKVESFVTQLNINEKETVNGGETVFFCWVGSLIDDCGTGEKDPSYKCTGNNPGTICAHVSISVVSIATILVSTANA